MDEQAIAAFWDFWQASADRIEADLLAGRLLDWVKPVSERVKAIDERLDWEFGAGRAAHHYFCVSAKGDPEVRVITERWRAAGPPDGPVFEFHASRPGGAAAQTVLDFGSLRLALNELRFGLETIPDRERVDLAVYHPGFAAAAENQRTMAMFIALDSILGEDDVERWVGGLEVVLEPPADAVGVDGLLAAIAALRDSATGDRFALLRGQLSDGAPIVVVANLALKRVDHLLLDTHLVAVIRLRSPRPDGMPGEGEMEELRPLEDALQESLGADAVFLGRETAHGMRVLHFHGATDGPALARMEAWRAAHPEWEIDLSAEHDPAWSTLSRW